MTGRAARWLPVLCALAAVLAAPAAAQERVDAERLYLEGCSSCHGAAGAGVDGRGPSLLASGEAAAYYYLSTGRMPLSNTGEQPRRKEPVYEGEQLDALVAYVAALGDGRGPELPDLAGRVNGADVARGGVLYRENCQACHSASGAGGALSYGRAAPTLMPASPLQVAAAMRSGPGQMPVFGPEVLSDADVAAVARYVDELQDPADPGGLPIGRTGPIPEGFVAWFVGVAALLGLVAWIGTRERAAA